MAKATTATQKPATQSAKATSAQIQAETARANALAKQYGGKPELLTLAEAQKAHPELILKAEDMANPAWFHLRFRACTICGRFPAKAAVHVALHANGTLDAKGHRTDKAARTAIALRVAKALKTLAGEKKPAAKAKAAKAA